MQYCSQYAVNSHYAVRQSVYGAVSMQYCSQYAVNSHYAVNTYLCRRLPTDDLAHVATKHGPRVCAARLGHKVDPHWLRHLQPGTSGQCIGTSAQCIGTSGP